MPPSSIRTPYTDKNEARENDRSYRTVMNRLTCVELCAGAGGAAIGLAQAGFSHEALVEKNTTCCETLSTNKPNWNVICGDLADFDGTEYRGVDLLSGGLPCPPFSIAGKQLGKNDERDCFPHALRIVREMRPRAILFENVPGLLQNRFAPYRSKIQADLKKLGYSTGWFKALSSELGVPQHRPRALLIGVHGVELNHPNKIYRRRRPKTVSKAIHDLMGSNGWRELKKWMKIADKVAPTITGGSEKHGGPDLGPTRARAAWAEMGVDGMGIANDPPEKDFVGMPRLTIEMVARIQAFPNNWKFVGKKTKQHRQIGNALPPPVSHAAAMFVKGMLK